MHYRCYAGRTNEHVGAKFVLYSCDKGKEKGIGRYMQRKYQRSIKFDKVMGISCVIVGFLSAVLSFGNIAAIAVAVAFLIAGFLD